MNTSLWLLITINITYEGMLDWLIPKLLRNPWEVKLNSDWLTLNLLKVSSQLKLDSDLLISKKTKKFSIIMARFCLVDAFETPWLDWRNFLARLNRQSILILFHVENNWLLSLHFFFHFYSFFEAIQLFISKYLGPSKSLFSLKIFLEKPSMIINKRAVCFACGREYARLLVSHVVF